MSLVFVVIGLQLVAALLMLIATLLAKSKQKTQTDLCEAGKHKWSRIGNSIHNGRQTRRCMECNLGHIMDYEGRWVVSKQVVTGR